MSRRLRTVICLLSLAAASALSAPAATADGLPLPFDSGENAGVSTPDTAYRYSAVGAGDRTVALQIAEGTGEIRRTATLHGKYGIPLVAYDGTAAGLSADGEKLILWNPRRSFPRKTTSFVLVETSRMKVIERVTLDGDFSFDALSPDGSTLYLIHYTEPRDPTAYEVRAYDLERKRLLREPIVDEDVAPVTMGGIPQTRAMSPDGRWAYTLYASTGHHRLPFIHALDTKTGDAACINLDRGLVDPRRLHRMDLAPAADGSTLSVLDRGKPVADVDLETFEVSAPQAVVPADAGDVDDEGSGWLAWAAIGGGVALVLVAGRALWGRRRPDADRHVELELERLAELESETDERERAREPVS